MPTSSLRSCFLGEAARCLKIVTVVLAAMVCATFVARAQSGTAVELFSYPDTMLRGSLSAEVSKPLEDCRSLCEARTGCAGFDHTPKGEVCRMFSTVSGAKAASGSTGETRDLISNYVDPVNPPLAAILEKLKQTDSDGHELFALAMKAFEKGNKAVGLEAINLAMQRGNDDAKLEMAKWYDPRTFAPDRVSAVDANKAARSYFELALEGNAQASGLLSSLCSAADNTGASFANAFEEFLRTTYCEGSIEQ